MCCRIVFRRRVTKDLALASRNHEIIADVHAGIPYRAIGKKYGISAQRVAQIVQESQESVSDDGWRSLGVARLEYIGEDLFARFCGPDEPQVNARGIVYNTMLDERGKPVRTQEGKLVQDYASPVPDVRLKIELAMAYAKNQERMARAQGTDRLKPRSVDQDEEMKVFMAELERAEHIAKENEVLRKRIDMLTRKAVEPEIAEAELVPES